MEENKNIREQLVADTTEYDKKLQLKKKKVHIISIVSSIVLMLLVVYFGFFHTKYELLTLETRDGTIEYGIRVEESTAFVVVIPSEYEGKEITYLSGDNDCSPFMMAMYIQDGIRRIGVKYSNGHSRELGGEDVVYQGLCFAYLRLPETVEEISEYAFADDSSLCWVDFPERVQDAKIGEFAFRGTGIFSLKLPEGVTTVERYAFRSCDNLREAYLPDSLVNYGVGMFMYCENLKEARISSNAQYLPNYMFYWCKRLKEIDWPDMLEYIGVEGLVNVRLDTDYPTNLYYDGSDYGIDIYDIEKENQLLAKKIGVPMEVLETGVEFPKIWIEGQYYELPIKKEDFLAMDEWSILDTSQSEDQEKTYMELKHNSTGRTLEIKIDKDDFVQQLSVEGDNCCYVVLPGGTMVHYTSPIRTWVQRSAEKVDLFRLGDYWDFYDNRINYKWSIPFGDKYECRITSLNHYSGMIESMTISVAEE